MVQIKQTTKHGLEVWLVLKDGKVVATAMSEQMARTIALKLK